MKAYLTVKELKGSKLCPIDRRKFRKHFKGNKAPIKDLLRWVRFLRKPEWEAWLLAQTPELTRSMLAAGADVNACNGYAFFFAETENRPEVLRLLREQKKTE